MITCTSHPVSAERLSDAALVAAALRGDRDAFGDIVTRYQTLVCSLAYSGTGSVSQSEDLAQDVFVTAWRRLSELREAEKLRAWLCGITRHLVAACHRRAAREPSARAEELEESHTPPAPTPTPSDHAISAEEAAILWRSLERIPAAYREPLILFYRQHQSIGQVAAALDLTTEAVRQRLCRGRNLLREEVLSLMEGTLARSGPGPAFTRGVMSALPLFVSSAGAASIGSAAAKGTFAAKIATLGTLAGVVLGPIIGIWAGWTGMKAGLDRAQSDRERRYLLRNARQLLVTVAVFMAVILGVILTPERVWKAHPLFATGLTVALPLLYIAALLLRARQSQRQLVQIRREDLAAGASDTAPPPYEYRSRWSFLGWPLIHVRLGRTLTDRAPARGWIAVGDIAHGLLFAGGGVAVAPVCIGGIAVGLIAIGGGAVGLFSFGGLALAWWSIGGVALGYDAFGGSALAWHAAMGGFAVAREFALAGVAVAPHVNDTVAAFMKAQPFFRWAEFLMREGSFIVWLPMLLVVWVTRRHTKAAARTRGS